jgi:hypothetical protein
MPTWGWFFVVIGAIGAVGVAAVTPDIIRYLRIRSM